MRLPSAWVIAGAAAILGAAVGGGIATLEAATRPWRAGDFVVGARAPTGPTPTVDVPETQFAFGTVGVGAKGSHEFVIRNTGAAWGLLSGWQTFLVVFSLSAMALLVWRRHALLGDLPWRWLVLGLLLGGICGNLIDRVWLRYVVDFIDFYYGRAHFPAFNVADASICVGVGLFMLLQWREERRRKRQPVNIEP